MTSNSMQAFITSHGSQWAAIVSIAYACSADHMDREAELLARAARSTKATIKRKFEAVHHKRTQGWTEEAIVKAGQGPTLSSFAASRKERKVEADVILRYRLSASLAEAWTALVRDKIAPALARDTKRMENLTSDDLFEFLLSVFLDVHPAHIANFAGELDERRKGVKV
jgi:hypothetical protein